MALLHSFRASEAKLKSPAIRILLCLLLATRVAAQPVLTPQAALVRVLQTSPAQVGWFSSEFLTHVPPAQIDSIVKQYLGQFGAYQRAEGSGSSYTVFLERGSFPAKIVLDPNGRITGLWFGLAEPLQASTLDESVARLAKLPGKVSVIIAEDGKTRASLHPDDPLAVSSAFKLAILATLMDQHREHDAAQVVPLHREWKTLPSGVLQTWPDSTPITIATYAAQMISISDNTAADALLSVVGREHVETYAPRNKPFLSTREAFTLKSRANAALLTRYRAADEAGRRALLKEIDALPLPSADEFGETPIATDIEWFFSGKELCSLVATVADEPAMRINPGLAKAADWQQIAFKGDSEGGVLNLTSALIGKNGKHYCVAATWNNTAVRDQAQFFTTYNNILSTLAKESAR